ncbi:MAG TPA: TetR/AcrR family transcriptional regulator [Candidatus Polarisedimenticolaceae bacterium]|nr:TetR/AcrR family transcriptional regulator [Candidatus Polarisedimenticolaceae bacterium]
MRDSNVNPAPLDASEERRRQILRAAVACFARRGFHQTTMHDISAEAEISVGLIYRYFENKDAVISMIAMEHLAGMRAMLEEAKRAPSLFEALKIVFTCHCEEQPAHVQASFVTDLYAEAARNEHVRALVRDVTEFFIGSLTELIASSEEAKSGAASLPARLAAELIVDSAHGMMMRAIVDSATLTSAQIQERQLAILRSLWPLLFTRATSGARVAQVQP